MNLLALKNLNSNQTVILQQNELTIIEGTAISEQTLFYLLEQAPPIQEQIEYKKILISLITRKGSGITKITSFINRVIFGKDEVITTTFDSFIENLSSFDLNDTEFQDKFVEFIETRLVNISRFTPQQFKEFFECCQFLTEENKKNLIEKLYFSNLFSKENLIILTEEERETIASCLLNNMFLNVAYDWRYKERLNLIPDLLNLPEEKKYSIALKCAEQNPETFNSNIRHFNLGEILKNNDNKRKLLEFSQLSKNVLGTLKYYNLTPDEECLVLAKYFREYPDELFERYNYLYDEYKYTQEQNFLIKKNAAYSELFLEESDKLQSLYRKFTPQQMFECMEIHAQHFPDSFNRSAKNDFVSYYIKTKEVSLEMKKTLAKHAARGKNFLSTLQGYKFEFANPADNFDFIQIWSENCPKEFVKNLLSKNRLDLSIYSEEQRFLLATYAAKSNDFIKVIQQFNLSKPHFYSLLDQFSDTNHQETINFLSEENFSCDLLDHHERVKIASKFINDESFPFILKPLKIEESERFRLALEYGKKHPNKFNIYFSLFELKTSLLDHSKKELLLKVAVQDINLIEWINQYNLTDDLLFDVLNLSSQMFPENFLHHLSKIQNFAKIPNEKKAIIARNVCKSRFFPSSIFYFQLDRSTEFDLLYIYLKNGQGQIFSIENYIQSYPREKRLLLAKEACKCSYFYEGIDIFNLNDPGSTKFTEKFDLIKEWLILFPTKLPDAIRSNHSKVRINDFTREEKIALLDIAEKNNDLYDLIDKFELSPDDIFPYVLAFAQNDPVSCIRNLAFKRKFLASLSKNQNALLINELFKNSPDEFYEYFTYFDLPELTKFEMVFFYLLNRTHFSYPNANKDEIDEIITRFKLNTKCEKVIFAKYYFDMSIDGNDILSNQDFSEYEKYLPNLYKNINEKKDLLAKNRMQNWMIYLIEHMKAKKAIKLGTLDEKIIDDEIKKDLQKLEKMIEAIGEFADPKLRSLITNIFLEKSSYVFELNATEQEKYFKARSKVSGTIALFHLIIKLQFPDVIQPLFEHITPYFETDAFKAGPKRNILFHFLLEKLNDQKLNKEELERLIYVSFEMQLVKSRELYAKIEELEKKEAPLNTTNQNELTNLRIELLKLNHLNPDLHLKLDERYKKELEIRNIEKEFENDSKLERTNKKNAMINIKKLEKELQTANPIQTIKIKKALVIEKNKFDEAVKLEEDKKKPFKEKINLLKKEIQEINKNLPIEIQELEHLGKELVADRIISNIKNVEFIFSLNRDSIFKNNGDWKYHSFKDIKNYLDQIIEESFGDLKIENFWEKFEKNFEIRNKHQFFFYSLNQSRNDFLMAEAVRTFFTEILEGTFEINRYEKNSEHLKIALENNQVKSGWLSPIKRTLTLTSKATKVEPDFKKILYQKIITDKHLGEDYENKFPILSSFLMLSKFVTLDVLEQIDPNENENRWLEHRLLSLLLKTSSNKKEILDELQNKFSERDLFYGDIQQLLSFYRKTGTNFEYTCGEGDDKDKLFNAGNDVTGSCQNTREITTNNKGLMGYVLDGKYRIAYVEDSSGRMIARSMLRLVLDPFTKKPVLFMERLYYKYYQPEFEQAIIEICIEKAKNMGVSLVSQASTHGQPLYPNYLESIDSRAPYEYVDAAGGLRNKKYGISSSYIIYDNNIS